MEELPKINPPGAKHYMIHDPLGGQRVITNLSRFCQDNGLSRTKMHAVAKGTAKSHKGFRITKLSKG